ncbi:hypothetical protein, partial [Halomonas sp.]|uniref:hypothetical protein n=1 Tax=Halomonas sp. TaxID=1486246 RepID=UPI0025B947EF
MRRNQSTKFQNTKSVIFHVSYLPYRLQENADAGRRKAGRWWPPGHGGLGETSRHLESNLEHAVALVGEEVVGVD